MTAEETAIENPPEVIESSVELAQVGSQGGGIHRAFAIGARTSGTRTGTGGAYFPHPT